MDNETPYNETPSKRPRLSTSIVESDVRSIKYQDGQSSFTDKCKKYYKEKGYMPQVINPLGHYICDCGMTWDGNAQHWDCPTLDEDCSQASTDWEEKRLSVVNEMANYFYTQLYRCSLARRKEQEKKLQNYQIFWNKLKEIDSNIPY
jgi:hypothetical protein